MNSRACDHAIPRLTAWIIIAVILVLKFMAIPSFRVDSDETQHAHVVWGWATGQLQYRDLFDNHMPLFHVLMAPYFRLFGEYANIMLPLRIAMLPFYAVCLWGAFRLAEILFSRKAAWWCCLTAALIPAFFYPSTEFRADDLWAVCWFISLVVAISGEFTPRRAFAVGLLLGLTAASSTKTVFLGTALALAAVIALVLRAWIGHKPPRRPVLCLAAIICGGIIAPGAIAIYFAAKGAFGAFFYCAFRHNVVPNLKRWGNISHLLWAFPLSLPVLVAYAVYIFRQAQDAELGTRRVVILLTPYLYAGLMFSYCPDLSRQDNLPFVPLLPLTLIPFILSIGRRWAGPQATRIFFSWVLPAVLCAEAFWTWRSYDLRGSDLRRTRREIETVFSLTDKGDYVMDDKGDYIFRNRPYYWVLEPVTKARIRAGLVRDDIPERLEATDTRVSYLYPTRAGTASAKFIAANYMPFDPKQTEIGVAGKIIGAPRGTEPCAFDVAIDATYALVSEKGDTKGTVDGVEYQGAVRLKTGPHRVERTAGEGRLAIFLGRAAALGYRPLFDQSEELIKRMSKHK
jgi:hypothetical protein